MFTLGTSRSFSFNQSSNSEPVSEMISSGTVAGAVIGVLFFVALVAVVIILGMLFLIRYSKLQKRKRIQIMQQLDILAM